MKDDLDGELSEIERLQTVMQLSHNQMWTQHNFLRLEHFRSGANVGGGVWNV